MSKPILTKAMYLELKSLAVHEFGYRENRNTRLALSRRKLVKYVPCGKHMNFDHITEAGYAALKEFEDYMGDSIFSVIDKTAAITLFQKF